jgi:hypothetical protein
VLLAAALTASKGCFPMSRSIIDDHVLRISVGIKSEGGSIKSVQVREIVNRLAADVRAPGNMEIAGFLELEDIPQDRRSQFLVALDTVAQRP